MNDAAFEALLDRAADGLASPAELIELDRLSMADDERGRELLGILQVEALLRASGDRDLSTTIAERIAQQRVRRRLMEKVQRPSARWQRKLSSNSRPLRPRARSGSRRSRRVSSPIPAPLLAVAFAGVALLLIVVGALSMRSAPTPPVLPTQPSLVQTPPAAAQTTETMLRISVIGRVQVGSETHRDGLHAFTPGAVLEAEDCQLRFADGSELRLLDATLALPQQVAAQDFSLRHGTLLCQVAPRPPVEGRFTITTDDASVTVLGTSFEVVKAEDTRVSVQHGRVAVATTAERIELGPGESVAADASGIRRIYVRNAEPTPSPQPTRLPPEAITLRVIDGATKQVDPETPPLQDGATIDLADFPQGINILFEVPAQVRSIQSMLDPDLPYIVPPPGMNKGQKRELERPFALWGDRQGTGAFYAVTPAPGTISVRMQCFADPAGEQSLGIFSWQLHIIDSR